MPTKATAAPSKPRASGSAKGHDKAKVKPKPPAPAAAAKSKPDKPIADRVTVDHVLHPAKAAHTRGKGIAGVIAEAQAKEAAKGAAETSIGGQPSSDPGGLGAQKGVGRFERIDLMNMPEEVAASDPNRDVAADQSTEPVSLTKAERRVEALNLRAMGHDFRVIAKELGVSVKTAYYDVQEALRYLSQYERVLAEDVRAMMLTRCDLLLAGLSDKAFSGDTFSVEAFLRVMERQSKLLGLDVPTEINVNVRRPLHNASPEELAKLMERMATARPLEMRRLSGGAHADREGEVIEAEAEATDKAGS